MANDKKDKKVEKPIAPKTKILQEGKNPNIEKQTYREQIKEKPKGK